ncbi:putative LysR-family transcriptional regulator [Actinoplanes missouriensis 431]|uniref:Putative LysR-family transcriptional regulator n=1 Tax=Actinoplanes missouriensis (strain ATCC 14538 / DSM 43046 / CBS 188.64 / JCM 3121 / NBRC 102363 / NCIMB 12654 / NRRL B-3342 / UNCC 431) TaxID=512565 RepID=I0H8Z7_ACTM4|nr:LysR substrate-binding domain-containing protein [Actinoplanes missouriensis]BAL89484.1 putative LysR-family transcriptional regulator [Actinoplanes missouriensis 431]
MELRHLRSFVALAEERHFGRAAERLHIAQPALSQQIKQLEREFGVDLVTRTTRRVELTEAGHRFAEHARTVLGSVSRASADMALVASGQAGRVSAGFIGTATYDLLPAAARRIRDQLPGVRLELHGELLSPALLTGLIDGTYDLVVLRPDGVARPDVTVEVLRTERLVAVLPDRHPLARRSRIDLAQLSAEPFVMHFSGHRSSMHEHVLAACAAAGFRPEPITEVGETATLVVFVAAGLGVALVPEPVRSLTLDGVTYAELADPPVVDLAIATRAGDTSPAIRQVAEIVTAMSRRCDGLLAFPT